MQWNAIMFFFSSMQNKKDGLLIPPLLLGANAMQYLSKDGLYSIGRLIEKAVADAEASGARVLTLGLLNQVLHARTPLLITYYSAILIAFNVSSIKSESCRP